MQFGEINFQSVQSSPAYRNPAHAGLRDRVIWDAAFSAGLQHANGAKISFRPGGLCIESLIEEAGHRRAISARDFAVAAHGSQMYGDEPYSFHLDQVAEIARPYGTFAEELAYLHDTAEDTDVSISEIEDLFSVDHAKCVALLSDPEGETRQERKAEAHRRFAAASGIELEALRVKVCDRLANVRRCVNDRNLKKWLMYRNEFEAFKDAAYRAGMCDRLWMELDTLLAESMRDCFVEVAADSERAA